MLYREQLDPKTGDMRIADSRGEWRTATKASDHSPWFGVDELLAG